MVRGHGESERGKEGPVASGWITLLCTKTVMRGENEFYYSNGGARKKKMVGGIEEKG